MTIQYRSVEFQIGLTENYVNRRKKGLFGQSVDQVNRSHCTLHVVDVKTGYTFFDDSGIASFSIAMCNLCAVRYATSIASHVKMESILTADRAAGKSSVAMLW